MWGNGGRVKAAKENRENNGGKEVGKVLKVHLMYTELKPGVAFFYRLHRQTTSEHLDINRYEKRCV